MLDILVASGLLTALVAVVTRTDKRQWKPQLQPIHKPSSTVSLTDHDLPCPWCGAATREDDAQCPSCRQRFG